MSQSNKMSVMQLTILTAVNMMGSGIIMLPTKLAQVGALSIFRKYCDRHFCCRLRLRISRHHA